MYMFTKYKTFVVQISVFTSHIHVRSYHVYQNRLMVVMVTCIFATYSDYIDV